MYHLSWGFNRKLFFKICKCREGWQNLSNNNFCENRMTGSIVALFVEWKVYERACERLIEAVMKIELLIFAIQVISLIL